MQNCMSKIINLQPDTKRKRDLEKLTSYYIVSPSGNLFSIVADTIEHAVSLAVGYEGFKYSNIDYLKLSKNGSK